MFNGYGLAICLKSNLHIPIRSFSTIHKITKSVSEVYTSKQRKHFLEPCIASLTLKSMNISTTPPKSPDDDAKDSHMSATARLKEAVSKVIPLKKENDVPHLSKERNFVTAVRAMSEFLLSPADLDHLRKTKRRSPFEDEPPITVYWRKDVEAKAVEVWGSLETLEKEKQLRESKMKDYQEHLSNLKRLLRSYQTGKKSPENQNNTEFSNAKTGPTLLESSGRVVWTAVVINGANFVLKLGAWSYTGSHSLFAEVLHSFADFTNQLLLAYGIYKSNQQADLVHPYGYTTMRNVSSLLSGAMIFCLGAGLSVHHGITGLLHPSECVPFYWAFVILGGSLMSESVTLLMAVDVIRKAARKEDMTFSSYVFQGIDPSVNVVLLEDMAAVLGVGVALSCMGLSSALNSHIPDAIGSCIIGGLLASVSAFIIYSNSAALVGRSIPQYHIQRINNELESDVMIRAIHDVKGIDMGSGFVRYKAEVDFDGRELTRKYIDKQDIDLLLSEVQGLQTIEEFEAFILKHGEGIVDSLGAEVDRIEKLIKNNHPRVRHIDLEIL